MDLDEMLPERPEQNLNTMQGRNTGNIMQCKKLEVDQIIGQLLNNRKPFIAFGWN